MKRHSRGKRLIDLANEENTLDTNLPKRSKTSGFAHCSLGNSSTGENQINSPFLAITEPSHNVVHTSTILFNEVQVTGEFEDGSSPTGEISNNIFDTKQVVLQPQIRVTVGKKTQSSILAKPEPSRNVVLTSVTSVNENQETEENFLIFNRAEENSNKILDINQTVFQPKSLTEDYQYFNALTSALPITDELSQGFHDNLMPKADIHNPNLGSNNQLTQDDLPTIQQSVLATNDDNQQISISNLELHSSNVHQPVIYESTRDVQSSPSTLTTETTLITADETLDIWQQYSANEEIPIQNDNETEAFPHEDSEEQCGIIPASSPIPTENLSQNLIINPETGLLEAWNYSHVDASNVSHQRNNYDGIKDKRKLNQKLRVLGEKYEGIKKTGENKTTTQRSQRQLQDVPCTHGSLKKTERSYLCGTIDYESRRLVFDYFWSLSTWEAKKAYFKGLTNVRPIVRRRKTTDTLNENENDSKRNNSADCYLPKKDGIKVRVCQKLFLSTLNITKNTFLAWYKTENDKKKDMTENEPRVSTQILSESKPPLKSDSVEKWLEQLSKVPSHYCRANTSRTYVDDALESETKMHNVYTDWCKENTLRYVQRKKFCEILKKKKISIFKPRKDQCDTCVAYKEGNLKEEDYLSHLSKKSEARLAKKIAIDSACDEHLVATMDLQSVQLCPKLLVSSQYYKQKLQVHIFTIYVNNNTEVHLYLWHEGDGGVTANEFVSCIVHFIEEQSKKEFKKISLISDGCAYQNKNKTLVSALADVSTMKNIEIEQIILEKGHTMMEVDSVHSTLEGVFKAPIYSPMDYVTRSQRARTGRPYIINHVDFTFFKNYDDVRSNFTTVRPGKKAGDPTVTDIKALAYRNGQVYYKLRHGEQNFELLPQRRNVDVYSPPQPLYTENRKIEKSKYDHLQALKMFMHRDYHSFYDNLSHK